MSAPPAAIERTSSIGCRITLFHIVLGELVPKSIALQRTEGTALFVARPLRLFARLFRPFILLMNGLGALVVRAFGLEAASEHASSIN
jgi:putative hemolysin